MTTTDTPHPRITQLLHLLRSESLDDQIVSTKTLCKLSTDPKWRHELIRCGIVSPLLQLTHSDVPRLKRDSSLCLIQLSSNCQHHDVFSNYSRGSDKKVAEEIPEEQRFADTDVFCVTDSMCAPMIDAILKTLSDSNVDAPPSLLMSTDTNYSDETNYLHSQYNISQLHSLEYAPVKHSSQVLASIRALVALSETFPSQRDYMLAQDAVPKVLCLIDRPGTGHEDRAIRDESLRLLKHLCSLPAVLSYVDRSTLLVLVGAMSRILSTEPIPPSPSPASSTAGGTGVQGVASWTDLCPHVSTKVLSVQVIGQLARCMEVRPLLVHAGTLMDILELHDLLVVRCDHIDRMQGSSPTEDMFAGAPEMLLVVQWALRTLAECTSFSRALLQEGRLDLLRTILMHGSLLAKESITSELHYMLQQLKDEEEAAIVSRAAKNARGEEVAGVAGWGAGTGEDVVCAVDCVSPQRGELITELCAHSYLPTLLTALDDGTPLCVEYVAGLMRHFAEAGRGVQGQMMAEGVIPRMVHVLVLTYAHEKEHGPGQGDEAVRDGGSDGGQTNAAQVLNLLSEDSSTHAEMCEAGAVPVLSKVLMTEFRSAEARKSAAIALANLSSSSSVKDVLSPATRECLDMFLEQDVFKWM